MGNKEIESQKYIFKKIVYLERIFKRSLNTKNISHISILVIALGLMIINFYFQNNYLSVFIVGLSISIVIQSSFSLLYFHPYWRRQLNKLI